MIKFEFNYDGSALVNEKGYATLLEVAQDICNKAGVELGSTSFLNSGKQIAVYDNTITAREYISYIAESAGCFACIGRDGKLYFRAIGEDKTEIPLEMFGEYKWGEEFQISKVSYEDGKRSFKFGDETRNNLWINQDNMFIVDEEQVQNIYNKVKGLTINSFEGKTVIDPCVDIGDKIIIDGKTVIYQGEMTLEGRFIAQISSKIQIKQKEETTVKKESQTVVNRRVQSEINQIDGKIKTLVEEVGDRSEKSTSVTQDVDGITEKIQRIEKSAITSVVVEYALSDSTTTEPQGGWTTTAPEWQEGKYMWQRTVTTYEDKTVVTGKAVCISGATGQQGIPGIDGKDGTNGTNGKNGKDGTSNYIHIKYSSVANPTDSQITEIPNKYIGICVNTTVADPTTASSYTWSKFEGKDGTNGINGKNGIDGSSAYVHFAYSTSADGKNNFSKTNFAGATYIGVLTDDVEEDSGDYTKYAWSLIKGDKGIGINKVETQYYLSTSKTTQTGGSWKTTQDTWKEGTYYWIRTKITYDNNEVEYTTPILNEDTNSLREAVTKIEKTADGLEVEVKKKLGITELGTQIEQNYEHVKVAWNQISEFIQMMIINNNASLAILDENKNVMMALDKTGQHFYKSDGTTVFGEMGVQTVDDNNYIAFSVESDYDTDTANGMAWGIKTKKDNKFHPILFIRNFNIGPENSDASFGELELNSSNLVLNGTGTGIKTGGVFINGDPTGFGLYFWDIENNESLLEIHPKNILNDASISILNNISFYRNLGGSNSLKLGNDENNRCLFTDDGSMYGKHLGLGSNVYLDEDGSFTGDITFYSIPTYQGNKIVYGQSGHKYFLNWTGSQLQFWVDTTNVGTLSDKRLKTDIQDIDDDFIKAIEEIEMKQFKVANRNGLISFGILAQDLIEIFKKYGKKPFDYEIVYETQYRTDDDTIYYAINYEQFLILKQKATDKKLKELQEKDKQKDEIIENLIKRIETLEKEVNK